VQAILTIQQIAQWAALQATLLNANEAADKIANFPTIVAANFPAKNETIFATFEATLHETIRPAMEDTFPPTSVATVIAAQQIAECSANFVADSAA
jgi:hypothetical protein